MYKVVAMTITGIVIVITNNEMKPSTLAILRVGRKRGV
jgi:hypothetical protein